MLTENAIAEDQQSVMVEENKAKEDGENGNYFDLKLNTSPDQGAGDE